MKAAIAPYELVHGASWLLGDGTILPVPGFHEAWIQAHPELVAGCANVCEVVLRKGWISVAVFSEGYVELLIPSRRDPAVIGRIGRLLASAPGSWSRALVMSMDEEGYATLKPADIGADGRVTVDIATTGL
jgi:hypothetical protein